MCPVFLIKTGSPNFNKVALSIASICLELETLVQENDFARLLHSYGEGEGSADSPEQQVSFNKFALVNFSLPSKLKI